MKILGWSIVVVLGASFCCALAAAGVANIVAHGWGVHAVPAVCESICRYGMGVFMIFLGPAAVVMTRTQ